MATRFAPLLCVLVLMTVPVLAAEGAFVNVAGTDAVIAAWESKGAIQILKLR